MPEVALGDVLTPTLDEVPLVPDDEYKTAGILHYGRGLFARPPVLGSGTKYKKYFRLHDGDFVYSKLFAWEGALTTVTSEFDGYFVSQEFPTFRIDRARLLPEYMHLLTQWPTLWEYVKGGETGLGGRRKRVHIDHLLGISVHLPALDDQSRVVDLFATLDAAAGDAAAKTNAIRAAQRSVLAHELARPGQPTKPIIAVMEHVLGGAWGSDPGVDDTDVISLNPSVFAGGQIAVDPTRGSPRSLPKKRANARTLRPNDIVIERSGGGDDQPVGRVVLFTDASATTQPVIPSDFMRQLRVNPELANPQYVYWALWTKYQLGDTREFSAKTTSIWNLRIPEYLESVVPIPDAETQRRVVDLAWAFEQAARLAAESLHSTQVARSALLAELLSGRQSIPVASQRAHEGSVA